jgi:hypothetical protein
MGRWDDDDDWVGTPPEGRHSRAQAKPEHWNDLWKLTALSAAVLVVLGVILAVAILS